MTPALMNLPKRKVKGTQKANTLITTLLMMAMMETMGMTLTALMMSLMTPMLVVIRL